MHYVNVLVGTWYSAGLQPISDLTEKTTCMYYLLYSVLLDKVGRLNVCEGLWNKMFVIMFDDFTILKIYKQNPQFELSDSRKIHNPIVFCCHNLSNLL